MFFDRNSIFRLNSFSENNERLFNNMLYLYI